MPAEEDLPDELAGLARNSLTLSDADWRAGEARLADALERLFLPAVEAERARRESYRRLGGPDPGGGDSHDGPGMLHDRPSPLAA
jgi:hypothetical protein